MRCKRESEDVSFGGTMTFHELEAKLARATERTELGYYEEAEQLTNEVIAELHDGQENRSVNDDTEKYPQRDTDNPDMTSVIRAMATLELAHIRYRLGDISASVALCEEVLAKAANGNLPSLQRRTWNLLGNIHNQRGSHDIALGYFERVLSEGPSPVNDLLSARATGNIGNVYSGLLNFPRAFEYFGQALPMYESLGDRRMIGGTKVNMAMIYLKLNSFEEALACLNSALIIFDELGERPFRLNAMTQIGIIHFKLEKYHLALEHYSKVLAAYEELGSKPGIAFTMTNIGVAHYLLLNYPLALEYHSKALEIHEELGEKKGTANSLANVGQVYHKFGQYNNALEYLYKALALYQELDEKDGITGCYSHIGHVYANPRYEGRDAVKAEELLLKSLAIETENVHTILRPVRYKHISEFYEQENRHAEALVHYKKYHALEKEILNKEALQTAEKYRLEREVAEHEREIAVVKAKAEAEMTVTTTLLHKVLPASIAYRLIKGEKVADYFSSVSILFADIVGFTPIASKMPARKVLAFLNYVFGEFDRIVQQHGCEKIKTIGDGYLAVAGAPIECSDHAERLARCAREMMNDIELPDDIRKHLPKGAQFSIRIGLHTGSVFAGIVGEERFVYDIYSDAVNIAARMESHGEPGRIHCSDDFTHHLQNRDESFMFEERDEIEIKGKGTMRTYFLEKA